MYTTNPHTSRLLSRCFSRCHWLPLPVFFLFFSWLKLRTSLKFSLPLWTTARASIAQTHIGIFLKHCDSLKTVATQQYLSLHLFGIQNICKPLSAKLWTFLKLELIIELWGRINNPHTQHLFIIRRRSYHLFGFLYVIKTTWTDKERESACRRRGLYFDKLLRKDKFPKKLETLAEKQYNQHFISHTVVAELWSVWPRIPNPLECVHAYSCHCVSLQRPCTNWLSIFSQRNVVESRVHKERKKALLSFLLNNNEGMGASL